MFCTAAMADTVIGNTLARNIRKIGARSSTPNQRIATGIHAMGEMGRSIWIIGLNAWNARPYQPSNRPKGTPKATASPNPQVTRKSDATMYFRSSPFSANSRIPRTTSIGLGNRSLPDSLTEPSQQVKNKPTVASGRASRLHKGFFGADVMGNLSAGPASWRGIQTDTPIVRLPSQRTGRPRSPGNDPFRVV